MGWKKGGQNITSYQNQDGHVIIHISQYGQIDHQPIKTLFKEFFKETGAYDLQQEAQSNKQMWYYINDLLTEQAKAKVLSYLHYYKKDSYKVKKVAEPLL